MPSNPGIYLFLDKKGKVLYIGKAKNLKKRVSSYFINGSSLLEKTKILIGKTSKIKTINTHCEIEALLLEANYIKKYKPFFNLRLTDGKAYPIIKITIKDDYPKILMSRRIEDKKSNLYFGPYPNAGAMRLVLKTIRKIFPFVSFKNHPKKICLYYHLGLCPCPPVFDSIELKKEYRKNIKRTILFLKGSTKNVLKDLKKERDLLSKNEEFEKAKNIQKKINSILLVTSPSYVSFDSNVNPNLDEDIKDKELLSLQKNLDEANSKIFSLKRIESFDISNISGKFAVGSMVVFIDGEKDPTLYRRFRMKFTKGKPNDFAMISEVVSRRLNHREWSFPDLIIIDGGKGQVSSVLKVLKRKNLKIALIGIAKREETIITSNFAEIKLPKDSKALHLVMRIRDEAHRFAITYHRNLRSKYLLPTS